MTRRLLLVCAVFVASAMAGAAQVRTGPGEPAVNADAKAMAEFRDRAEAYATLRRKVEEALPRLSTDSTPEEIDKHQRALLAGIAKARATAKPGDLFTPPVRSIIRRLIAQAFARGNRQSLRESIQDEDIGPVQIAVNARYPDGVPLANMPAELLKNLPTLPSALEYRFVGDTLILLDPGAHLIVDFIPRAMPR